MIDWNKPIETVHGGEAFYVTTCGDGRKLVTYKYGIGWKSELFYRDSAFIRNKPDLIKPKGWVVLFSDSCTSATYELEGSARNRANGEPQAVAIVSLEELISGKFKDGIPKGYGLGGDDE